MRTALSCFLADPLTGSALSIYDVDPNITAYGIIDGEPGKLRFLEDRRRVITPLEDILDLEKAAWDLLLYVAKIQKEQTKQVFSARLYRERRDSTNKQIVEKNGIHIRVHLEPEYIARHPMKDGKHGLMIFNPIMVELVSMPLLH